MTHQTLLILDALGIVRFCNNPHLFGSETAQLYGKPLASLMPTLLLGEATPGDNVAYARHWWADGPWQGHQLATVDGRSVSLAVCLRAVVIDRKDCLLVMLRNPPLPATRWREIQRLFQSAGNWAEAGLITALEAVATYVSRAFEKIAGYGRSEIAGDDEQATHCAAAERDAGEPIRSHVSCSTALRASRDA
jgi:hypothetical protein